MATNSRTTIKQNQNATKLAQELKKTESLYPILTKEEEREMIEKYRNDRETLNQLLVLHNVQYVYAQARKIKTPGDFDDMIQNGMRGLAEAAAEFDIDKGTRFLTFAGMRVFKYMTSEIYKKNKEIDQNSVSLNSPGHSDSGDKDVEFEDYVNMYAYPGFRPSSKTNAEQLTENAQTQLCASLMHNLEHDDSLTDVEKNVFIDLFYGGSDMKIHDISAKYKISRSDINQIKHKIISNFKLILEHDYSIASPDDIGY